MERKVEIYSRMSVRLDGHNVGDAAVTDRMDHLYQNAAFEQFDHDEVCPCDNEAISDL